MTDVMTDPVSIERGALALTILAPLLSVFLIGLRVLLWRSAASERFVTTVVHTGLLASIGAGAVVTKDVPAGTVMVGVPARVLRDVPEDELRRNGG